MPDARKYSDEDVREIIERALRNDGGSAAAITHADLLAIGEQVGVPPDAMARAAEEISRAKLDAEATQSLKSRRQKWLAAHAAIFAVVNGLLFAVNFLTTPGEWWFLFSVFFWGLAVTAHAGFALGAGVSRRAVERQRRKLEAARPPATPKVRIEAAAGAAPPDETAEAQGAGADSSRVASRS